VADLIDGLEDRVNLDRIRERTLDLARRFPLPYSLT